MDDVVKQIMFGAQKQASRQNDVLVEFVKGMVPDNLSWSGTVDVIKMKLKSVVEKEEKTDLDKLFISMFLGDIKVSGEVTIGTESVGDKGKVKFTCIASSASEEASKFASHFNTSEISQKSISAEDEAYALVEKILAECPNRNEYPEDDVLAALMYGEIYWRNN